MVEEKRRLTGYKTMILTGFQLRAARRALNLHLEQLHQNTIISVR